MSPSWPCLMSGDCVWSCWLIDRHQQGLEQVPARAGPRGGSGQCRASYGQSLHPVFSQQAQPSWAGHPAFGAFRPGLFLNLASRQSYSEAARPTAKSVSFS